MPAVPTFAISIDIDWAPDDCIDYARQLLDQAGLPATFFTTHRHGINLSGYEEALHPNFLLALGENRAIDEELAIVKQFAPQAVGVRGHCLAAATRFFPAYAAQGLQYESSHLVYGRHGLEPYWMIEGVIQLPIFWEDDLHTEFATRLGHAHWSLTPLELDRPGLKVFVFHPVHLWLNTTSPAHYQAAKVDYQDAERLRTHRQNARPGTDTLFCELLDFLVTRRSHVLTLKDVADRWRRHQGEAS